MSNDLKITPLDLSNNTDNSVDADDLALYQFSYRGKTNIDPNFKN